MLREESKKLKGESGEREIPRSPQFITELWPVVFFFFFILSESARWAGPLSSPSPRRFNGGCGQDGPCSLGGRVPTRNKGCALGGLSSKLSSHTPRARPLPHLKLKYCATLRQDSNLLIVRSVCMSYRTLPADSVPTPWCAICTTETTTQGEEAKDKQ